MTVVSPAPRETTTSVLHLSKKPKVSDNYKICMCVILEE